MIDWIRAKSLGYLYKAVRCFSKFFISRLADIKKNQQDLESVIDFGDTVLDLIPFKSTLFKFPIPNKNKVSIYDLEFPSPFIVSSFKMHSSSLEMWSSIGAGAVIVKTILPDVSLGNPRPRIQEVDSSGQPHLLNAMGLPGPGVASFISTIQSWDWLKKLNRPVGISIGGHSSMDYFESIKKIESCSFDFSYFYELNISCPNTPDGANLSKHVDQLDVLLKDLRQLTNRVISVKLSPAQTNKQIKRYGDLLSSYERMMVNVGNTRPTKRQDVGLSDLQFSRPVAGLSGPSLIERTREMVRELKSVDVPIIATGGISNLSDVYKLKTDGADLFGMATSLVFNPFIVVEFNKRF